MIYYNVIINIGGIIQLCAYGVSDIYKNIKI